MHSVIELHNKLADDFAQLAARSASPETLRAQKSAPKLHKCTGKYVGLDVHAQYKLFQPIHHLTMIAQKEQLTTSTKQRCGYN